MKPTSASEFDRRIEALTVEAVWREHYAPESRARVRRQQLLRQALAPIPGERILDAGCGAGALAYWAAQAGTRVVGLDYSLASLRAAREIGQHLPVGGPSYLQADASQLPFVGGRFDTAICVDVMDVLPPERHSALLAELLRVVRPGGIVILYTPNARREALGRVIRPLRRLLGAWRGGTSRLHIGLMGPTGFRRLLRGLGATGTLTYADMNYPRIARLPLLRTWLAGHMLWTIPRP